jgi:prepilin-type N-terminal cleavage/methylation domain-containing protein
MKASEGCSMKKNTSIINKNAFSLLEITVVMIIISILLSAVVPVLSRTYLEKAANKTILDISAIQEASNKYYIDNNQWPAVTSLYLTPIAALQAGGYLPSAWKAINPFGVSSATPTNYAYNVSSNASLLTVCTLVSSDAQAIIQNSLPSPYIDANGNVCSGIPPPGTSSNGFGQWTAGYNAGQVYQAPTDGEVVANSVFHGSNLYIYGYTDSVNASTMMASNSCISSSGGDTRYASITMPVRKGDYWQVTCNTTPTIRWLPRG